MDEDKYIAKLNTLQRNIHELQLQKSNIITRLKILEAEKEELENNYNLEKIKANKNGQEWADTHFEWSNEIVEVLLVKFKYLNFRQKQLAAINGTMAQKDVLLLMPTGGGKSLVYQLAAYISKGITLVVSPLISLIDDQLRALHEIGIRATTLNSNTSREEKKNIYTEMLKKSDLKLLYVTPEWVAKSKIFMSYLQKCFDRKLLARIVIDEVHCCSTWGHDFRPDYKYLGLLRTMFVGVPIIGLTATATMNILVDIQKMLNLEDALIITAPFNRPNLYYKVINKPNDKSDCIKLLSGLLTTKYKKKSGIIYTSTVKETEDIYTELKQYGLRIKFYHAQMQSEDRKKVHTRWMENVYHVIVATIAFGMGIDKPDVRFVIHYSTPKSMEAFYQESGRAGRDGKEADCVLLFNLTDYLKTYSMTSSRVEEENAKSVLHYCVEQTKCRRALIAEHFEDTWRHTDCAKLCDHCRYPKQVLNFDITDALQDILSICAEASYKEKKVTLNKLINAWFCIGKKEIRPDNIKKPKCSKQVAELIVAYLIYKEYLSVEKGFTLYSTLGYIQTGNKLFNKKMKVLMPSKVDLKYPTSKEILNNSDDAVIDLSTSTDSDIPVDPPRKKIKTERK